MCLLQSCSSRNLHWRHILLLNLFIPACLISSQQKSSLFVLLKPTSTQNGCSGSWSSWSQNKISTFSTWFQPVKRSAQELTCAGIVIDPDVARMADAHEGARGVNAHGVLPAVVLPFSALINIWREGRERGDKAGLAVDYCHISITWICKFHNFLI